MTFIPERELSQELQKYHPIRGATLKLVASVFILPLAGISAWSQVRVWSQPMLDAFLTIAVLLLAFWSINGTSFEKGWWKRNVVGYTLSIQRPQMNGGRFKYLVEHRHYFSENDIPLIVLCLGGWRFDVSRLYGVDGFCLHRTWTIRAFQVSSQGPHASWVRIEDANGNIQKISLQKLARLLEDISHGSVTNLEDLIYSEREALLAVPQVINRTTSSLLN